ncbi:hypothetical protein F5Y11DRAFT_314023 [Daldinia sp. FL1419]|nr:hypothetical protein F5Y11DRAFT_314023 [Daldinia sp. FL1419]
MGYWLTMQLSLFFFFPSSSSLLFTLPSKPLVMAEPPRPCPVHIRSCEHGIRSLPPAASNGCSPSRDVGGFLLLRYSATTYARQRICMHRSPRPLEEYEN